MKYAEDIVKEIDERGPIKIPDNCCASDGFDKWMYGKEKGTEQMSKRHICDEEGNVIDVVEEVGIFEYSETHDLNWLKRICTLSQTSRPKFDYDKGRNEALDFVIDLINKGMIKEQNE